MQKLEIYDYHKRLERHRQAIAKMRNGTVALAFLDHLLVLGLSIARVSKYACHMRTLLRQMHFDVDKARRKEIEETVAWITLQDYKEWTKHDFKLVLRKLIQYAKVGVCSKGAPLLDEVNWIPLNVKDQSTVKPEDLVTPDEIQSIFENAKNPRDYAILSTMFEGALRPGEFLTMTMASVRFENNYCIISVDGKTGVKCLPLVLSYQPLLRWMQEHPYRANPQAPLWVSRATNGTCKPLHYSSLRDIIKDAAKRAGIKKRVWNYLFRHTYLTTLAKSLTEPQLKQYAGWTPNSKMASKYVHFCARDLEEKVKAMHGLQPSANGNGLPQLKTCPRSPPGQHPPDVRPGLLDTLFHAPEQELTIPPHMPGSTFVIRTTSKTAYPGPPQNREPRETAEKQKKHI